MKRPPNSLVTATIYDPYFFSTSSAKAASSALNREGSSKNGECPPASYQDIFEVLIRRSASTATSDEIT